MTVILGLTGVAVPATAAGTAAPSHAQQSGPLGCDYVSLYDQTIDSVVSVQSELGFGSGFVYAVDNGSATVVTNAHVVGEATTVQIEFSDGESRTGTVVGQDALTDLAVIDVSAAPDGVSALDVNETTPQHGQPVAALGSPLGLQETITHGIVSGVNRSLPTRQGFRIPNTVQTDAAISPGNSGGPLVNCDGQVIGVNTAGIAAPGVENLGFAISGAVVERVVPELAADGEFAQSFVGVSVTRVTPAVAEANDLDGTDGVVVLSTQNDTPADGVLQGPDRFERVGDQRVPVGSDVIVAVDGTAVRSIEDFSSYLLLETQPGDEVTFTVIRDGERTNVTTTLAERSEPQLP